MAKWVKAQVGDFIRMDGRVRKVIYIENADGEGEEEITYFFEDGGCCGNRDFSVQDILLESEVN